MLLLLFCIVACLCVAVLRLCVCCVFLVCELLVVVVVFGELGGRGVFCIVACLYYVCVRLCLVLVCLLLWLCYCVLV